MRYIATALAATMGMLFVAPSFAGTALYFDHQPKIHLDGAASKALIFSYSDDAGQRHYDCFEPQHFGLRQFPKGYLDTGLRVIDGSRFAVAAANKICAQIGVEDFEAIRREKVMTVPGNDGLHYLWVNLY